jgi:hypothetical protein
MKKHYKVPAVTAMQTSRRQQYNFTIQQKYAELAVHLKE